MQICVWTITLITAWEGLILYLINMPKNRNSLLISHHKNFHYNFEQTKFTPMRPFLFPDCLMLAVKDLKERNGFIASKEWLPLFSVLLCRVSLKVVQVSHTLFGRKKYLWQPKYSSFTEETSLPGIKAPRNKPRILRYGDGNVAQYFLLLDFGYILSLSLL